jgi:hypothetical protein
VDAQGEAAGATASPATAVAAAQNPRIMASFGADSATARQDPTDLCGQTDLDAEAL